MARMAKDTLETVPLWAFGQLIPLRIDHLVDGSGEERLDPGVSASRRPTYYRADAMPAQVVLHSTGNNKSAAQTLGNWNSESAARRRWEAENPEWGRLPREHRPRPPYLYRSAHFVVERPEQQAEAGGEHASIVQIVPPSLEARHAKWDRMTIGIEHVNAANTDKRIYPSEAWSSSPDGNRQARAASRHHPDRNQYLLLQAQARGARVTNYQALPSEQYRASILLVRRLCAQYRIPRRFWLHGHPAPEQLALASGAELRRRHRGLWTHCNGNASKPHCGGAHFSRNRIWRGVCPEWWLPVQLLSEGSDGGPEFEERIYYMGPFEPRANERDFVRWMRTPDGPRLRRQLACEIGGNFLADPDEASAPAPSTPSRGESCPRLEELGSPNGGSEDLEAYHETKSYFQRERLDAYYQACERGRGTFPVGTNRSWHGGVHLHPPEDSPRVYAAASGVVVAARVDPGAEVNCSSARFVLVRHCVFLSRLEGDGRLDWSRGRFVHSLYMHLGAFASVEVEDPLNPPWLNLLIRRQGSLASAGEEAPVISPSAPLSVMVGDWLGDAGRLGASPHTLHFEVFSKDRLPVGEGEEGNPPTFDGDLDHDIMAEDSRLRLDLPPEPREFRPEHARRAAAQLRRARVYKVSEWALTSFEDIRGLAEARTPGRAGTRPLSVIWDEGWQPFMWVAAFKANAKRTSGVDGDPTDYELAFEERPRSSEGESGSDAFAWCYHPVTFMDHVKRLVEEDDRLSQL